MSVIAINTTSSGFKESEFLLSNSGDVSRSTPSLMLKTFALRMAVMTVYGHLGTLQGLSGTGRKPLLRILMIAFWPGATLMTDCLGYYIKVLDCLFSDNGYSWRWCTVSAAGLHIPIRPRDDRSLPADNNADIAYIGDIPFHLLKHIKAPWTWDSFLLKIGRVTSLAVVLAQAIACLVLVIRRRHLGASLLLDSSNGLYALIGILSSCNSMMILAVGGKWEFHDSEADPFIHEPTHWSTAMFLQSIFGLPPILYSTGQPIRKLQQKFPSILGLETSDCSLLWFPQFAGLSTLFIAFLGVKNAIRPFRQRWGRNLYWWTEFSSSFIGPFKLFVVESSIFCAVTYMLLYWITSCYELYVITHGLEMEVWGSEKWRWYDPWSDMLLIY
jgi:hypothetical protein